MNTKGFKQMLIGEKTPKAPRQCKYIESTLDNEQ